MVSLLPLSAANRVFESQSNKKTMQFVFAASSLSTQLYKV